ncbi:MAG TPA: RICIN domain-containing protein [Vicinamibacterales bacterium]|jgi:hypothetical protein
MRRTSWLVLAVASLAFGSNGLAQSSRDQPSRDQSSDQMLATRRCDSELNFRMARDVGGRNPNAVVNDRRSTARQVSGSQWELTGPGRYTRDNNDRGRSFTYTCRVDVNSGNVEAQYQWSGSGGFDSEYDRNDSGYPPSSAWGYGGRSATPQGRVWVSGGIISKGSGKGLDVEGRSTANAANVQQWEFGGGSNQKWDVIDLGRGEYAIVSQGSNKVLTVADASADDGANIVQYRWNGGDNQRWRIERSGGGFFEIVNVNSDKCLDVEGKKTDNGVRIQQWSCGGAPNQLWRIAR